jgi:mono/diheme cytochrome c family protein
MRSGPACIVVASLLVAGTVAAPAQEQRVDAAIYSAWQAMRQLDCARCHGRDYTGSVGPSLLETARTRSREEFARLVLDGNAARGMPPYRDVKLATDNVEGMYGYLAGRANGTIPAGTLGRQ